MSSESYISIIGISAFLCLALGIILFIILYQRRVINHQIQLREFNQQKELELIQASIRSEEEERMRIASELHDDVGATLSSIRLFLQQALRSDDKPALIVQSTFLLDESIQKVRDISHQLQPSTLQYLGLVKALQSFAEMITRSGTVHMEVMQTVPDWPDPDPQTALSLYRVIQELVNNTIKHAHASWIQITTSTYAKAHCIMMTHNGNGLSETAYEEQLYKKGAIGLKNIEGRLKSAGLTMIFPEPLDHVYTTILCLPAPSTP